MGGEGTQNKGEPLKDGAEQLTAESCRVGVRIPPFYPEKPALWFAQLEGQFILSKITADETKFYYAMAQLEPQYAAEVEDIITSPPAVDKYIKLKTELIKRLSASRERKVQQVLNLEELGDKKPSQFLRHLQNLAGPGLPEDFLRSIWVNRLPQRTQDIVASQLKLSLEDLAELADRLHDVVAPTSQVAAASALPSTSAEPLLLQIAELTRHVRALDAKVTCIVCQRVFCCSDCRWRHEATAHGLTFDCPLCRGSCFLCQPDLLNPAFLTHLQEHLPLHCSKCEKQFNTMEDLADIDKCTSLSELIDQSKNSLKVADERFDSLYEKIIENNEEDIEAVSDKINKTAVITPIVRKKYLVDYEASDTEPEDTEASPKVSFAGTAAPKTPRLKRSATPHVKKLLLARQQAMDEGRGSPDLDTEAADTEMTTPTSRLPALAAAALAVTTSTPTHHAAPGGWALFSAQTESPLSEIELADSPQPSENRTEEATEQTEPEQTELEQTDPTGNSREPKLKSIISSRRIGSADSLETEARSKRVKFADGTVFQPEPRLKRVFRKPKRMLTPGPTKARFCCNPRFQALINRFEHNAVLSPHPSVSQNSSTMARTPVNNRGQDQTEHNVPRAIDFKDSPAAEDNKDELFKSCMGTPGAGEMDIAITALSTNIAGSLQTCISNVLKHTEEETEIQFKFTITKKKVSVQRAPERECPRDQDKENLWATVAKAVKNAFWGEGGEFETPHKSISSCSSSSSKRKQADRSRSPSPLSHKRGKYEPRLRGRPPLRQGLPLTARLSRGDATSHSF